MDLAYFWQKFNMLAFLLLSKTIVDLRYPITKDNAYEHYVYFGTELQRILGTRGKYSCLLFQSLTADKISQYLWFDS